ncbi:uncharacterized protein EI90DRAFT_3013809 [Cantharellus anzutake]|uniref:uncharacterized protein n=1 Tax=Cantharellus anzutake TaxID=1750568 RepID=UPI001904F785|nr:uncharacterized protein EI90DRAFT_3013809 [Cantharellus anzutake]KAF8337641.1 hypothetical protein EI90DRAFT_3013809 [Cantharellus anzutake]
MGIYKGEWGGLSQSPKWQMGQHRKVPNDTERYRKVPNDILNGEPRCRAKEGGVGGRKMNGEDKWVKGVSRLNGRKKVVVLKMEGDYGWRNGLRACHGMSEVRRNIGANPGSLNVLTRDRGSGMGVAKVRCAATRPELRQSGGKVTWGVGRHGVGDGEVVRKVWCGGSARGRDSGI